MREYLITFRRTGEEYFIRALSMSSCLEKAEKRGINMERPCQISSYPVKDVSARLTYIAQHDSVVESHEIYSKFAWAVIGLHDRNREQVVPVLKEMFGRFPQRTPMEYINIMYHPESTIRNMIDGNYVPNNGKNIWPNLES